MNSEGRGTATAAPEAEDAEQRFKQELAEKLRAQAEADALLHAEVSGQADFYADRRGAYQAAWEKYAVGGGDDPTDTDLELVGLMATVEERLDPVLTALARTRPSGVPLPSDYRDALVAWRDWIGGEGGAAMVRVDAILRADTDAAAPAHALAVLDAMTAPTGRREKQLWDRLVRMASGPKGVVMGEERNLDAVGAEIRRYAGVWDALGTDGLKGASYTGLRKIEDTRMRIVRAVADSGDDALRASCSRGTAFYDQISALAAQTCSSRTVQNFEGWWRASRRNTD